ncbi:hypothetical protein [Desulfosporosinus nitroreducens]|uniref:hypothetical protein n=1 Tax=Desulfosporosinus nitroreducens TaxID=2018668 RepID=UPI00207D1347|nr:hypothetical protein [Desulfosporosinus nitroreducens]MCO1604495.1 hypothetical protein [Desulfosporosinus nitroreducens]
MINKIVYGPFFCCLLTNQDQQPGQGDLCRPGNHQRGTDWRLESRLMLKYNYKESYRYINI